MKTLLNLLMILGVAVVLGACGDPGDFEDTEQDSFQQQDSGQDF